MLALTTLLFTSLLAGFAAAQNFTFDPTQIPLSTKNQWCLSETNTCPLLCGGDSDTAGNDCDGTTLTYNCTCTNGSAPDLAAYTNTLPFLICQSAYGECIAARPNDADGQTECKNQFVCGSLNPNNVTAAASSTSSSASSTTSAASTTSATAASTTASASATATKSSLAISIGHEYGFGLLLAGLFAAIGLLL